MIKKVRAYELTIGMLIGYCKVRKLTEVRIVTNGDVYARYETLGLFPKTVRYPARQLVEVKI